MEINAIHISEVLKIMNRALKNHEKVNFKAWKKGRSPKDPEAGSVRTYDGVYITSHSREGNYKILDPLAEDERYKYRNVCEAFITEFMGKKVIW